MLITPDERDEINPNPSPNQRRRINDVANAPAKLTERGREREVGRRGGRGKEGEWERKGERGRGESEGEREATVPSRYLIESAHQQSKRGVIPDLRSPLKGNYAPFIKQNRKCESREESAFAIRTRLRRALLKQLRHLIRVTYLKRNTPLQLANSLRGHQGNIALTLKSVGFGRMK